MTLRQTLLATAVVASAVLPGSGIAQPISGLYVGAGAGLNNWLDNKNRGIHVHDNDIGVVALASIGWGFGNGFRAEVEGNYRNQEIKRLSLNDVTVGRSGDVNRYGAMANLLFDFDLSGFGIAPRVFQPYLGAGAGYAWTEYSNARFNPGASSYRIDDTGGAFAWQAILGGAVGIAPGLALTVEYRYFNALQPDLAVTRTAGPVNAAVPGKYRPEGENHSLLFGLRYAFNAPPAPPPVAEAPVQTPAPEVARTYLVFFDWDRADLTDRARQVITEAATATRRLQSTKIEVAGHADRSGTPQYNQRLSERRAQAVAAELVRQGINRSEIGITAYGESRPLVPTADGVREPQNRRVEIVLR
ncbi:OmpA family protein [Belnapia rosea]|uniref:Outer membrane protein OmpA n=1 Tax=Belnapia rosea TaxID=938405 RepID=A0A1G6VM23_9PROT|nr:OmpA family protein [Belnapia rosea]SDB37053.1 Outer membrane protein OmpA [Belnapia rosea]SDD54453.1 Outer membrane protein OmpA [Belnapia rosea]